MIAVSPYAPADLPWLSLQGAQALWLGVVNARLDDPEYARGLAAAGPAWTVRDRAGWILAIVGLGEINSHYAVAWSLLGRIGHYHLPLTRAIRRELAGLPYRRIEALVRADYPPACRWAVLLGFEHLCLVRAAGPEGEDYHLFERVRP